MKPKAKITKPINNDSIRKLKSQLGIIIILFSIILYAQSFNFGYVLDDGAAIKDNHLITKGIESIPIILKTDYWSGLTNDLRVPLYRPASLVLFAIEWQFFPNSPHICHFINILLFSITCWLLFLVLSELFKSQNLLFPFICALLYTAHPIHTETVDNIKSGDDLLCFLFALLSIYFFTKTIVKPSVLKFSIASICYFISLFSKESGIVFLIITPLSLFVLTKANNKQILQITGVLAFATAVFLLVRYKVLQAVPVNANYESPINNSIFTAKDFISQRATAVYVLMKYLQLLILPHPLSYDYSLAQIPIQSLMSPIVIAGIIIYLGIAVYSLINIKKKSILAFGILFFLITLAPVANIFLLIGSPMAERFLYIPSLGFCIVITFLVLKLTKTETIKNKSMSIKKFFSINSKVFIFVFIITGLYSIKTISRNPDWQDNFSLFGHDVNNVDNSARAHYNWGATIITDLLPKENDKPKQTILLDSAINELTKAVTIFKEYPAPYSQLGFCYFQKQDYKNAVINYEIARHLFPIPEASIYYNLGSLYTTLKEYDKALNIMDTCILFYPTDANAHETKGITYLNKGDNQNAIKEFEKAINLNPQYAKAYCYLGGAYYNMAQYPKALEYMNKSLEYDPNDASCVKYVGMTYQMLGDSVKANQYYAKSNQMMGIQNK